MLQVKQDVFNSDVASVSGHMSRAVKAEKQIDRYFRIHNLICKSKLA